MGNKTRNTSNLVSDNNIFVDISNDRVGIGSTQPTTKLDVVGTVKATSFSGITTAMISDYGSGLAGGYSNTNVDSHINVGTANTGEVLSWNGSDYDWVVGVQTANINADTLNVSGVSTFQDNIVLTGVGKSIQIGPTGDQLSLEYDTNGVGLIRQNNELFLSSPSTQITNLDGSKVSATFLPTGGVTLKYNNNDALYTTADGITVIGGITASSANFTGNVSVGGTLTYEDVTNIDSIGLVTARSGVRVTGGGLDVVGVTTFQSTVNLGNNDRLNFSSTNTRIYGASNALNIEASGTHDILIKSNSDGATHGNVEITTAEGGRIDLTGTGGVGIYHTDTALKLETTADGINVTGIATATTFSGDGASLINVDATTAYSADLSTLATISDKVSGKLIHTQFDQISQVDQPAGTPKTVDSNNNGDYFDLNAAESYLSKDGKTLFVSRFNWSTQNESNVVTIYERNQSGFNYVGFITETTYANVGAAQTVKHWGPVVSSSSDGSIFAIGSPDGYNNIDARSKNWWLDLVEDSNSASTGSQQSVHIYQRTGNNIESLGIITASQYGPSSDNGHVLSSDGEDGFGTSLAFSDDGSKLYIGAPGYFRTPNPYDTSSPDFVRGRVYAFDKSGSSYNFVGIITQTRDSTNNGNDNGFGISVACSSDGNKIYIGDPQTGIHTSGHPDAFSSEEGVVYAYDRSGSNFNCVGIISTRLFPEGDVESFYGGKRFGYDVACSDDGNTIIISAPNISKSSATASNNTAAGAIHVVSRDGNTFSSSGRHIHTSADSSELGVGGGFYFGRSIACNSDASKILSSKTGYGSAGLGDFGEVFSFFRSGSNLTLSEILTSPRETGGNSYYSSYVTYGTSISIDSTADTIAIGGPGHIVPGEDLVDSGAVFLFSGSRQISLHGNQLTNNIGIGTANTNPTATLDVDGTFKVSGISTFLNNVNIGTAATSTGLPGLYLKGNSSRIDFFSQPSISIGGTVTSKYYDIFVVDDPDVQYVRHWSNGFDLNMSVPDERQFIVSNTDGTYAFGPGVSDGDIAFKITPNSSTELRYDCNKKLETTGYGVTVTGGLSVSGVVTASSFSGITTSMISDYGNGLGGGYSNTNVDTHLNTSTASSNEVLSWTGSDYDWVAQSSGGSFAPDDDKNLVAGTSAGASLNGTSGCYNVFLGCGAGESTTSGANNIGLGCKSGPVSGGSHNVTIGTCAGKLLAGSYNLFLGHFAGKTSTDGCYNVFLGPRAGQTNDTGCCNVAIGWCVELPSATGNNQFAIGSQTNRWITGDSSFNVTLAGIATVTSTGIVSATKFCGDGSCLTNLPATGFSADAQENLYAGTGAGAASDADTEYNIGIGYSAGHSVNEGDNNVFLGKFAGKNTTSGNDNVFLGTCAGEVNDSGSCNVFLGHCVGTASTDGNYNIFLGSCAGYGNQSGCNNIIMGCQAACAQGSYCCNIIIGACAGKDLTGNSNIFLGYEAGKRCGDGDKNIIIGDRAGCCLGSITSSSNILIGECAGKYITGISKAIMIGNGAGCGGAVYAGDCSIYIGYRAGSGTSQNGWQGILIGNCAGSSTGTSSAYNIALGNCAGRMTECGTQNNISIGSKAGYCISGSGGDQDGCGNNISIGQCAGYCGSGAGNNIFIGCKSGYNTCYDSDGACNNVFLGASSGTEITTGRNNTFLGHATGCTTTDGSYNVAIGYGVTLSSPTASNEFKVGIGNTVWLRGDSSFNIYDKDGNQLNGSSSGGTTTTTGSFTAIAGVAYTANTYTSSDFVTSEYRLFFEHTSGIQSQKVLVMDDETTAYSQEYAIMSSSDLLVSVGATIKSGNVELWFTPESGVSGIVTYKFTRETII